MRNEHSVRAHDPARRNFLDAALHWQRQLRRIQTPASPLDIAVGETLALIRLAELLAVQASTLGLTLTLDDVGALIGELLKESSSSG